MKYLLFVALALFGLASAASAQQPLGTPAFVTSQVSVATSATRVAIKRPTRASVLIATTGTAQVYCGADNTVTSSTGYPIANVAFSSITILTTNEVWCIAASAQTVAVLEAY